MASEEHMLNASRAVTGDDIEIAGLFEPKGMRGKRMLGTFAGAVVGETLGNAVGGKVGMEVGDIVGGGAGRYAGGRAGANDGKVRFVVAASSTKVHILQPEGHVAITHENLSLRHSFDRSTLSVSVHGKVTVRTLVLTDTATGDEMELEGSRAPWSHSKETLEYFAADAAADAGADVTAGQSQDPAAH